MIPGKKIIVILLIFILAICPVFGQMEFNPSVNLENADQPLCQVPILNLLINECAGSSAGTQGPAGPAGAAGTNGSFSGTITSNLSMGGFYINNLGDPLELQDAASKNFVENRTPIVFHADNNSVNQGSVLSGVVIKFTNEVYDTGGFYNQTISRFTTTVSGYYYFKTSVYVLAVTSGKYVQVLITKNGVTSVASASSAISWREFHTSAIVYLDGIDDYVDVRFSTDDSARTVGMSTFSSFFEGYKL